MAISLLLSLLSLGVVVWLLPVLSRFFLEDRFANNKYVVKIDKIIIAQITVFLLFSIVVFIRLSSPLSRDSILAFGCPICIWFRFLWEFHYQFRRALYH